MKWTKWRITDEVGPPPLGSYIQAEVVYKRDRQNRVVALIEGISWADGTFPPHGGWMTKRVISGVEPPFGRRYVYRWRQLIDHQSKSKEQKNVNEEKQPSRV